MRRVLIENVSLASHEEGSRRAGKALNARKTLNNGARKEEPRLAVGGGERRSVKLWGSGVSV